MSERVVVTGLGVVSSLGCTLDEFWSGLVKAESGISEVFSFDTGALQRHRGGEIKNFEISNFFPESDFKLLPRTHKFALSACSSALKDSGLKNNDGLDLILGSIVGGLELIEYGEGFSKNYPVYMTTANVCSALGLSGQTYTLSGACAAGNYALSLAYEKIKSGESQAVLAGAADYFSISTFIGFYRFFSLAPFCCQPFDKNRKGMLPAEGAGMLLLESLSSARKRGARIYAEILGYGNSVDAYHAVIPSCEGVLYCMRNALEAAGLSCSDVDYISAHGTGTVPWALI